MSVNQMRRLIPLFLFFLMIGLGVALTILFAPPKGTCHIGFEVRRVTAPVDKHLSRERLTTKYGSEPLAEGVISADYGKDYVLPPNLVFRVTKIGAKFCSIAFERPMTDVKFSSLAGKLPSVHYKELQEASLAEKLPDTHRMSEAKARDKLGVQEALLLSQDAGETRVYILRQHKPNTRN